ncbi:DENN/MADD domain containing 2D, partial [Operophtera brumata]
MRPRHQTSICSYRSDVSKPDSDNPYSTFRSWKNSTGNILSMKNDFDVSDGSIDTMSIDEKTGCVDIELPFEPRERGLFNVCLLVGLNYMTAQAYVKSVFPSQVQVPQHIENLIFPETLSQDKGEWSADASFTQCYSFVLTDERGERSYGVLQQLFESDFPSPGEEITLTIDASDTDSDKCSSDKCDSDKLNSDKAKSDKCKTMPEMRSSEKFYDPENNNSLRELMLSLDGIRIKTITRPLEPRAEESSSCDLLDTLGAGLLVKVFGSLLLERKLIVRADKLSALSSWLEALQSALYPFVWQQPLISCVPAEIQRAVLDAPLPILAGMLDKGDIDGDSVEEVIQQHTHIQTLISCVPAEIQRAVLDAPLPILAGMLDKGDIDGDSVE